MAKRSQFNKSRFVAHDMPIGIDKLSAVHQFPEIRVLFIQMSGRDMADIEGVFLLAQRLILKTVRLNSAPVYIVKRPFGVKMPQLNHAGLHTEMRKTEFRRNSQTDLLVFFSFMRIRPERPAFFCHKPPHESDGHHQSVGAAIRLLFHPVHRIADFFVILRKLYFLRLHAQNVIVMHLLQAEEQIVFVVMDALVKNVEIRILLFDAVRIDHDGVSRDFPLFGLFALFR